MVSSSIFFCMALLTDYKKSFQNKFKGLLRDEIFSAESTEVGHLKCENWWSKMRGGFEIVSYFSVFEKWKYKDSQLLFWMPESLKFMVFVFIGYKLRGAGRRQLHSIVKWQIKYCVQESMSPGILRLMVGTWTRKSNNLAYRALAKASLV